MTEQVIATDFLITAKAGVKNYAVAISEAATPEVREVLKRHLSTAIKNHEAITQFMMRKGYYHVHNLDEQLIVDNKAAETVIGLKK